MYDVAFSRQEVRKCEGNVNYFLKAYAEHMWEREHTYLGKTAFKNLNSRMR